MLVAGEVSQMLVRGGGGGGGVNGTSGRRFDRLSSAAPSAASTSTTTPPPSNAAASASHSNKEKRAFIPRTPLHSHFRSLAAAFELSAVAAAASAATNSSSEGGAAAAAAALPPLPVLCGDCASRVAAELELETEAALEEARLAEEALMRLQAEAAQEGREAKEQEREAGASNNTSSLEAAEAAAASAEKRALAAAASLRAAALDASQVVADAAAIDALEEAYWLELDAALSAAASAADDAAATLARAERASACLESLKSRDAICDLHRIWHDDEGGYTTVAGCRAGKGAGLGWDEANAALGSAARLLATLIRVHSNSDDDESGQNKFFSSSPPLRLRLLPAGSTARVVDARSGAVHDLFGPVNKLYCGSFDKGVALFAGGVRDFALAAAAADERRIRKLKKKKSKRKNKIGSPPPPSETVFSLPYEIEPSGERVSGLSLRLMLNKDSKWTRALKYLLADLKCCAAWSARERARRFRWEEEEEEEEEEDEVAGTVAPSSVSAAAAAGA